MKPLSSRSSAGRWAPAASSHEPSWERRPPQSTTRSARRVRPPGSARPDPGRRGSLLRVGEQPGHGDTAPDRDPGRAAGHGGDGRLEHRAAGGDGVEPLVAVPQGPRRDAGNMPRQCSRRPPAAASSSRTSGTPRSISTRQRGSMRWGRWNWLTPGAPTPPTPPPPAAARPGRVPGPSPDARRGRAPWPLTGRQDPPRARYVRHRAPPAVGEPHGSVGRSGAHFRPDGAQLVLNRRPVAAAGGPRRSPPPTAGR